MAADERIVLVDADLSNANGVGKIRDRFPERVFNVGVAEANMASMAAGGGFLWIYSIYYHVCPVCYPAHLRSGSDFDYLREA